jgi:hypothetical protein
MTLRERATALLDVVDEYRERECRTILERAHYEAARVEARAHAEARRRVHEAVVQERQRAAVAIRAAQAELQTERRGYQHRRDLALLDLAWPRLRAALERRWEDAAARQQWVAGLVTEALRRVPSGRWTVFHPPAWPAEEREAAIAQLTATDGPPPEPMPDTEIIAGLRLTDGATTLDGTVDGLIGDRPAVAGRLLALLQVDESDAQSSAAAAGRSTAPLPLSPSHKGEGELAPSDRHEAPSPPVGEGRGEGEAKSADDEGDPP